ncbi:MULTISPECIES: hypothetical protein [Paraburkholderia]|uniref:hypothetical protein n=1 Tax=Paraburkholderia TaxID=1822464 RepID=UPI0038BDE698
MKKSKWIYYGHHFPAEVTSCEVPWYLFKLSLSDIEERLPERDVIVIYETNRCRSGSVRQVGNALSGIHHRQARFPACLRSSHSLHAWCGLSIWPRFSLY